MFLEFLKMGCVCGKEELNIEGRRFEIVKKIGEGGFSVVFLAQEKGKKFAIKRISCHSKEEEERAKREVELHQKLGHHPHILSLEAHSFEKGSSHQAVVYQRDAGLSDSTDAYLVFPFYKRGTLFDDLLARKTAKRHLSQKSVLELFLGVCRAILAFHQLTPEPYSHRDIKSGNVLLAEDDTPILMDFGSARPAKISVKSSRQAATLQDEAAEHSTMTYRAPELFRIEAGSTIDEKTDVWSLGCLLYALCYFESPFDAVHERGDSVALAVGSGRINFPESSPYSSEIQEMIESILKIEPDERPSVSDLISQTSNLLAKTPNLPAADVV